MNSKIEKMERELVAQRKQIENLTSLLDLIPGSVYWKDKDGKYIGRNAASAQKMYQCGFEETVDKDSPIGKTDYDIFSKDIADRYRDHDLEVMKTGEEICVEESVTLANGKEIIQLSSKRPLRNWKGEIIGVIGNTVDITQQKNVERELRQAKVQAEESSLVKQQFIDNIRHDLRTPTSNIVAILHHFAEFDLPLGDDMKELIKGIKQEADRLMDYCERTVDFSEIYRGSRPIVNRPFSLHQVFDNVCNAGRLTAQSKNLEFIENYAENEIPEVVIGDSYRVENILMQLIHNAVQYTNKGCVIFDMKLSAKNREGLVIDSKIEDTGLGIPEEKQDKIYEAFEKVQPSYTGHTNSVGIGLSIVKQFVHELEGDIILNSQMNQGSRFNILLPFKQSVRSRYTETV